MNHPWLPRVIAALGLVGLCGSFACFPVTVATIPLDGSSGQASPPTQATPSASARPSPAASPTPTATPST